MIWLAMLFLGCGGSPEPVAPHVHITNARVRAMPPGSSNSAAFFTIENEGPDTALMKATSTVAESVELHTHTLQDGMMRMRQVPSIPLPSHKKIELKPGGLHVMLIGLRQNLLVGEDVTFTFTFADQSSTSVNIPINAIEPGQP